MTLISLRSAISRFWLLYIGQIASRTSKTGAVNRWMPRNILLVEDGEASITVFLIL